MKAWLRFGAVMAAQLTFSCGGGGATSAVDTASSAEGLQTGVSCTGALTGNVNSNLIVPSGATCTATAVNVHGSVFVQPGALGLTLSGSSISGRVDISSVNTGTFSIVGSIIPGFVTVNNPGSAATFKLCGSIVHGRVVVTNNKGAVSIGDCGGNAIGDAIYLQRNQGTATISSNSVKEDIRLTNATSTSTILLANNFIEDNLVCTSNANSPGLAGNTVHGTNNCGAECPAGQSLCGSPACHDLQTDPANCGSCGAACGAGGTCTAGVCLSAATACTPGTDLETGDNYVVCASDATSAWVSAASSGHYHAKQICQTLGYTNLGDFGGTCGNTCGFCEGTTSCSATGNEHFDGNGNCGSDAFGDILCLTVQWKCTR